MWLHAGHVRRNCPLGLLEYSSVNSSLISVTGSHLHYLSQVYFTTIRPEGKHAMSQLRHGTWLKVGGRADINKVLAFAITNPFDGLIP
jgi:hypothetical protein